MTRYIVSGLFLSQMIWIMTMALYGAILALSAVTNLSLELSIVSLGVICAFYCYVGGLKAVLWTDVYQAFLIWICILAIYVVGIMDGGGISKIYYTAKENQRLDIFDLRPSLTKRYDFWGCVFRGLMYGIASYGTNQIEIQRILSLNSSKKAQKTLQLSLLPVSLTYAVCSMLGIVLYSIYYKCDPILNGKETGFNSYDQLVPSYIVNKFSSIPGMTGLCIAGIFSASLSTISSALNSASTVTVIDLMKPLYKNEISDMKIVWLVKFFSIVYGGICIGLCFCFLNVKTLLQLSSVVTSGVEGPLAAVFLFGVLTRKGSDRCSSFAMILGYLIMVWMAFGSMFSHYRPPSLPLSIEMCPSLNASSHTNISEMTFSYNNWTLTNSSKHETNEDSFFLYKISFTWHSFLGFILTSIFLFLAVLVTGWKKYVIPENSKCLSPVTHLWLKKSEQNCIKEVDTELIDHVEPLLIQGKI